MEEQRKPYEEIKIEVITFAEDDVIRTSGGLIRDDLGVDWLQ